MGRSTNEVRVRSARRQDLQRLSEIWLELMDMHQSMDSNFTLATDALDKWTSMAEEMLDRDDTFVFVAQKGTQLLGFCLGWVARNPPIYQIQDVGFLSEIAVARLAHRQGVGTLLMGQANTWFAAHDVAEFQLSTAIWNEKAQSFWKAMGGSPLLVRYRFDVKA